MAELYTKTSSGAERIDVSVPKIEERVTNLENNKLGKTEKAASALVADSANSIEGANVTGTVANATNAINAANATTATSATSASSVPWAGITNKPTFAVVATTGSYNDLKDRPKISSNILTKIFEFSNSIKTGNIITITGITPYKLLYINMFAHNASSPTALVSVTGVINTGIVTPPSYANPRYIQSSSINNDIIYKSSKDYSQNYYVKYSSGYTVVLPSSTSVSINIAIWNDDDSVSRYYHPCKVVAYQ